MKRALAIVPVWFVACGGSDDGPVVPPDARPPVPEGCIDNDTRAKKTVTVSGQVIDFTTSQPVAGATVDLTTAWDVVDKIPKPECPLLGTATTDAQGRFGPVDILAGSTVNPPVVLFTVTGADRARTLSDARTCAQDTCNLGHTIAAPSTTLAAQWRADLATGGMTEADTRGLVAFLYKNGDGSPAMGVVPFQGSLVTQDLRPGLDVRFVDAARSALMPAAQTTTSSSGVAIIGIDAPEKASYFGGRRGNDAWNGTGCLVIEGAIFVEDKSVQPPM